MTEDTIFDLASLTKCLATATAVMPLPNYGLDHIAQRPVRG
jgi:CubicO group peptidase (beta-lactamase class C family)